MQVSPTDPRFATLRREFPDFPMRDLPLLPPGFVDSSWHNDAMPYFIWPGLGVGLWVNYSDPDRRDGGALYAVVPVEVDPVHGDQTSEREPFYEGDDWLRAFKILVDKIQNGEHNRMWRPGVRPNPPIDPIVMQAFYTVARKSVHPAARQYAEAAVDGSVEAEAQAQGDPLEKALRYQANYVLSNLSRDRGPEFQKVREILRNFAKAPAGKSSFCHACLGKSPLQRKEFGCSVCGGSGMIRACNPPSNCALCAAMPGNRLCKAHAFLSGPQASYLMALEQNRSSVVSRMVADGWGRATAEHEVDAYLHGVNTTPTAVMAIEKAVLSARRAGRAANPTPFSHDDNTEALAAEFSRTLARELGPRKMAEVVKRNREHMKRRDVNICASGDFCDSNMTMERAFRRAMGRKPVLATEGDEAPAIRRQYEEDVDLWNAAWDMAKKAEFRPLSLRSKNPGDWDRLKKMGRAQARKFLEQ